MSLLSRAQDASAQRQKSYNVPPADLWSDVGGAQGFLRALLSPLNVELDLGESSCSHFPVYRLYRHHSIDG